MSPDALAALHAAAQSEGDTGARPWSAAEFAALLAQPRTILAARPGVFALGQDLAGEAELMMIATHPAHRRRGLARACLRAYESQAAERGAEAFLLEVAEDNAAALALYLSEGYRAQGRRKGYYPRKTGPNCDALILRKPGPHAN